MNIHKATKELLGKEDMRGSPTKKNFKKVKARAADRRAKVSRRRNRGAK